MDVSQREKAESEKKIRVMIKRRITGIALAVGFAILWFVQGMPLRIGFVAMMIMSIWEMYGAFRARGARPIRWVGMLYAALSLPAYLMMGMGALMPLLALCCMLGLGGVIIRGKIDFESAVATLFPLIYPGSLISMFFGLMDFSPPLFATVALGLAFFIATMADLFAYEVGMRFGKRKLSPVISPNKTIEGSIAGLIGSVVSAMLVPVVAELMTTHIPIFTQYYAKMPPVWFFALMGLAGGAAAQIGDLTASMVKRYCGIKDYGAILPGHGGMMDRIDSTMFTGAVVYIFMSVIGRIL